MPSHKLLLCVCCIVVVVVVVVVVFVFRKRVRTVDEEDKNSDEDKGNQVRDLMRENRELGKLVEELRQELELEKGRGKPLHNNHDKFCCLKF